MIINASPLIIFGRLNKLELLKKVFGELVVSQAVYQEVVEGGIKINAPEALLIKEYIERGEIKVKRLDAKWQKRADFLQKVYTQLDIGEAQTIALALQEKEKAVLIDERIARKVAKLEGLMPQGSLRVLLVAFKKSIITEEELRQTLTEMTSTKFRLSAEVINKFWMLFEKLKKSKRQEFR